MNNLYQSQWNHNVFAMFLYQDNDTIVFARQWNHVLTICEIHVDEFPKYWSPFSLDEKNQNNKC
jgi:hypothetical protein